MSNEDHSHCNDLCVWHDTKQCPHQEILRKLDNRRKEQSAGVEHIMDNIDLQKMASVSDLISSIRAEIKALKEEDEAPG